VPLKKSSDGTDKKPAIRWMIAFFLLTLLVGYRQSNKKTEGGFARVASPVLPSHITIGPEINITQQINRKCRKILDGKNTQPSAEGLETCVDEIKRKNPGVIERLLTILNIMTPAKTKLGIACYHLLELGFFQDPVPLLKELKGFERKMEQVETTFNAAAEKIPDCDGKRFN
jgi:hypothetical protein